LDSVDNFPEQIIAIIIGVSLPQAYMV